MTRRLLLAVFFALDTHYRIKGVDELLLFV